jgi:hypothetical protein
LYQFLSQSVQAVKQNAIDWLASNNANFFFTVLEAEKSRIKALADLVSGEGVLPGS